MRILYLSSMSPVATIVLYMRRLLEFVPQSESHQRELAERHTTLFLPGFEELVFSVNHRLLKPEFYAHCLEKIRASGRFSETGPEFAVARRIAASSRSLIRSVTEKLATPASNPAFSLEMMKMIAAWRNLMLVTRMAYPEIDPLALESLDEFFGDDRPNKQLSLSNYLERAEDIWNTTEFFNGQVMTQKLKAFRPDVVFLNGSCPTNLPFFVAAAKKLKGFDPNVKIFIRHGGGLQSANIHYKDWFLENDSLYDLIDGVIMYTDVADLTGYQIVKRVEAGRDVHGLHNLIHRHHDKVSFSEPNRKEVNDYIAETKIFLPADFSFLRPAPPPQPPGGPDLHFPAPQVTMVRILSTRQACYWYKCNFCDINDQNYVLKDPHLSRRGEEVSQLLLSLRGHGVSLAFVDAMAVPPEILRALVDRLSGQAGLVPWGYEARFESFLTPDFVAGLRKSGCVGAIFGLESAVGRINKLMNKYPDAMGIASIEGIIDEFDRNGMMAHVNTIVNLPGMSEDDFRQHSRWLHAALDAHRLFHFNTNSFQLRRGSAIARRPLDFGIELDPGVNAKEGYDSIPFSPLPDSPVVKSKDSEIYKECLGFDRIWGISLFVMHGIYHERLLFSFFDATRGENLFKRLKPLLKKIADIGSSLVRLPASVCLEDDGQSPYVILAETEDIGICATIPRDLWGIAQQLLESEEPVAAALERILPETDRERREGVLELIKGLAADGLLE